jgi:hypothetical protein
MRATVVVLPVPGPPATTAKRRRGGQPLALVGLAGEEPGEPVLEHVVADVLRWGFAQGL